MTFSVGLFLSPPSPTARTNSGPRTARQEDYDSTSSTDSAETARDHTVHPRPRTSFTAASSGTTGALGASDLLYPMPTTSGRSSLSSTATSTPVPSRSTSPLPQFYSASAPPSSSCSSDTDSEPNSPLLGNRHRDPWWREERRRWWTIGSPSRRRRRREANLLRRVKKGIRRVVRHPFFPKQPITIVLTLLLLSTFAVSLTLLLIRILNPDKEPLPWRAYCSVPPPSTAPPDVNYASAASGLTSIPTSSGLMPAPFPPVKLESLPPTGLFVGVFSMDSAFERRMIVRNSWANHPRSRLGADDTDGGQGTSRTVVRFILGQPRKTWEKRISYEQELYNDIIILPVGENMNSGKTHAFFTWAADDAWVPPLYFNTSTPAPNFSYSNSTIPAPPLAPHDPSHAWDDSASDAPLPWVRPDYVVKVDDDSFVMLAELEARLRLELHSKTHHLDDGRGYWPSVVNTPAAENTSQNLSTPFPYPTTNAPDEQVHVHSSHAADAAARGEDDPLIYWGYLVKNRFMAGELYALSWSLAEWVARDPVVKGLTKGAEDKQTAKWMHLHPKHEEVRWVSERCWIYDHPRAGTVYSHGFLFPSEVTRVRRGIVSYLDKTPQDVLGGQALGTTAAGTNTATPAAWAYSTVSTFGVRYSPPLPDLTTSQGIEALVEGSDMSLIREGSPMTPEYAWQHREGRKKRYEGKRVGGTVVVHFIKKNMWFLETALAMLEGADYSESEALLARAAHAKALLDPSLFSKALKMHRKR